MENSFLGGWNRQTAHPARGWARRGPRLPFFSFGPVSILVQGYVTDGSAAPNSPAIADRLHCAYRETGVLPVDSLEGSFSLVLLDTEQGRVVLYRNLVGSQFTYYCPTGEGLLFGSNLAELAAWSGLRLQVNREALPAYFIYRYVPGRETLLRGFYRLLPGEEVCSDAGGFHSRQRQKLGDWQGEGRLRRDALDELDATMSRVVSDCAALDAESINFLSGGVDSSYLQVHWNEKKERVRRSCSISVDHPRTWPDTDYARSAACLLGTRHQVVPADGPVIEALLATIARSAEPPHHVQSVYFGRLGRVLAAHGLRSGLTGQGADALFGLGESNVLHQAVLLRRLLFAPSWRRLAAGLARAGGRRHLEFALQLADRLHHFADRRHPINTVGAFTDWEAVEACFGGEAVARTLAERRGLLIRHAVCGTLHERLHSLDFLTDSSDTVALWSLALSAEGVELRCPFLDSRLVKLACRLHPRVRFPFCRPKALLKQALARRAGWELAYRRKLAFGQPIFEWLAPGGQLRPWVEQIGWYDFLPPTVADAARARPGWFLYNLLCYDLWHQLIIDGRSPGEILDQASGADRLCVPA